MGLSHHIIFPLDNVEEAAQFIDIPRGELLSVAMNRFNGNVVMSYADHPEARFFIRLIVAQLSQVADMFDEECYREPRHGLIDYEDDGRYEHFYGAPPPRSPLCPFPDLVEEVA